jgi:hypothetical protein
LPADEAGFPPVGKFPQISCFRVVLTGFSGQSPENFGVSACRLREFGKAGKILVAWLELAITSTATRTSFHWLTRTLYIAHVHARDQTTALPSTR